MGHKLGFLVLKGIMHAGNVRDPFGNEKCMKAMKEEFCQSNNAVKPTNNALRSPSNFIIKTEDQNDPAYKIRENQMEKELMKTDEKDVQTPDTAQTRSSKFHGLCMLLCVPREGMYLEENEGKNEGRWGRGRNKVVQRVQV